VIVPVRFCGCVPSLVVLAATLKPTVPFPVPDAPDVTVIQPAFDDAVHVQFDPVMTLTLPVPPLFGTLWLVGEME
jgi:hypothetical protein